MSTVLENFRTLVSQMMKARNVDDYELYLKGSSGKGNGFMGLVTFFKILSKQNGKTYHLVMKSISTSDIIRKLTVAENCFDREMYMYTVVVPHLKSFLGMKTDDVHYLEFIPRLYWYSGEYRKEGLILENLKHIGYTMPTIRQTLNLEHTQLVMKALANWHGVMMAFRDQNRKVFESWIPNVYNLRLKLFRSLTFLDKFLPLYYKEMYEILERKGFNKLAEKYKNLEGSIGQYVLPASDENDRLVIVHGDCWLNNILFKYGDDSKTPIGLKLLDYQFSSLNTPVEDLSFFLYGCCDKEVLDKFDTILAEYYYTLSSTIRNLGSNPENLFTFDQLEQHWKKYGFFGVLMMTASIRLQYMEEKDVPDFDFVDESFDPSCMIDYKVQNVEEYSQRILNVLVHFGNKYL